MELTVGTRVDHPKFGIGIISKVSLSHCEVFFERGGKYEFSRAYDEFTIIEMPENAGQNDDRLTLAEIEKVMVCVLDKYASISELVPLAEKWTGGTMQLTPGKSGVQGKDIPIEVFFHKIVMIRDRLRVMEQQINAHAKLSDEDKVNLQQYITRIYGSLTSFNILFSDRDHYFTGAGQKD
jgi:hypothetical protein